MAKFLISISIILAPQLICEAITHGILADNFKGRLGVALVDSVTKEGEYIQCSGALISQKHVLTSRMCCQNKTALPVVIMGSTIAYDEYGERFRTVKHCWVGKLNTRLIYTQTCLLTLARRVIFRDTLQPFLVPVQKNDLDYNEAGADLRAFGFGSTKYGEKVIHNQMMTLHLDATVDINNCNVGDSGYHECAGATEGKKDGQLNYNDVGGPIATSIDLELYGISGSWYIPRPKPGATAYSIILPISKIRDYLLDEMAYKGEKCLHNN